MSRALYQIIETCIYQIIDVAVKILKEKRAQCASDIDLVWLNGYELPAEEGGPIYFADTIGADAILEKMNGLRQENPAYAPAQMLKDLAETGGKFSEIDTSGLKTAKS